jgi:hypothetical protein
MIAAISFLLSYALQGLAEVTDGLTAEPLKKPLWAFQPTSGKMFVAGATWPMAAIANAYVGNPSEESRAVAFALLGIAMRLVPLAAMIWGPTSDPAELAAMVDAPSRIHFAPRLTNWRGLSLIDFHHSINLLTT